MSATSKPKTLDLRVAGSCLRAYDYGNHGAPPMVLVHGIQDLALSLEPLALAFCDRFHVVSYDLRGHGDSDKTGGYTFASYVADLLGLLTELELEQPVLIGHSLGGQIASYFAGVFEEVPSKLISIEGLGPPMREGGFSEDVRRARTRERIEGVLKPLVPQNERRPIASLDAATDLYLGFHPRLDPATARRLVELGTEPRDPPGGNGGLRFKWDPRVLNVWLSTSQHSNEEVWSWVSCPTLLLTGELAAEFWSRRRRLPKEVATIDPSELTRRVDLYQDAQHLEIPGAGHMVHYDAPQLLISAIGGFLEQD